jgi:hypothetical protein
MQESLRDCLQSLSRNPAHQEREGGYVQSAKRTIRNKKQPILVFPDKLPFRSEG